MMRKDQNSLFVDTKVASCDCNNETICEGTFDPTHPNADWSGFIPQPCSKRHPVEILRAVKVQLVTTLDENGLAPREDADTSDWSKKAGKRMFYNNQIDHKKTTQNHKENGHKYQKSHTFSLIGGPVPMNNPDAVGPKMWETNAQIASKKTPTDLCQLTHNRRSMHVRGLKKIEPKSPSRLVDEMYPICNTNNKERNQSHLLSPNENDCNNNISKPNGLIGFRAKNCCGTSTSLISGLGKQLAKNIKATKYVSSAPYATDGNIPTDPYLTATGERRKDMLVENYSSVVPGYTGVHRPNS